MNGRDHTMPRPAGQLSPCADETKTELATPVGLSDSEAQERLTADGPNELPTAKPRGILAIAVEVAREPMFVLLVAARSADVDGGGPPGADVRAARGSRQRVPGHGSACGCADAAGLRVRSDGHHHRPRAPHRARFGSA